MSHAIAIYDAIEFNNCHKNKLSININQFFIDDFVLLSHL